MRYRALALLSAALVACSSPATPSPTPVAVALPGGVPTAAPGWITTGYWLGSGAKDTETFTTTRPEWRLVWRETKSRTSLIRVDVRRADSQAVVATYAPASPEGGGSMPVRTPPGAYFLRVQGFFGEWAVAVEEAR